MQKTTRDRKEIELNFPVITFNIKKISNKTTSKSFEVTKDKDRRGID